MNSVDSGAFVVGWFFILVMVLIGLVGLVFWIWMLVHAIQNKGLSDTERIMWVLVIIFVNLLGAIVYFFVGRPRAPSTS